MIKLIVDENLNFYVDIACSLLQKTCNRKKHKSLAFNFKTYAEYPQKAFILEKQLSF